MSAAVSRTSVRWNPCYLVEPQQMMVCVFIRQSPISIRTPLFSEAFEQHVCVLVRRCLKLLELCGCARETGRTGDLHQKNSEKARV